MSFFKLGRGSGSKRSQGYSAVTAHDDDSQVNLTHEFKDEDLEQELRELKKSLFKTRVFFWSTLGLSIPCLILVFFLLALNVVKVQQLAPAQLLLSPVPPIPMTTYTFQEDPLYAERPDPSTDQAWNDLLPDGRGFVFIDDYESYSLPPGEETPYGTIFSVALFHQLHCLGQLRKYYWMLLDGVVALDQSVDTTIFDIVKELNGEHGRHVTHCFDYLRQSVMCAGDMSMEWPRTEPDGRRFAVDGWGIPHECKTWDYIHEYMEKNHFNMSTNKEIAPHKLRL
ncbi:MAG: hypothetical protein M1820_010423 [Bogoriella megaspora]|nr:MAG: hypothetical protein M1820_010423 [Bogoriella megaspora]